MLVFPRLLCRCRTLAFTLLASALTFSALAQSDPPGRVGRMAWMSGDVYLNNPDTGEIGVAPLNQPLTSGDVITTQSGSRVEIQIGAMTLRLDANTRIKFDQIDDERIRVVLNEGQVIVKLPTEETQSDFSLETDEGRFAPLSTGIYRLDRSDGETTATAYFGTLRFDGGDIAFDVPAGESAHLGVDRDGQLRYRMTQGVRDEFTQWSAARDQQERTSVSSRHVSPEMTGAQDLDAHGDWDEQAEYGAVWFPRAVAVDWAPYRMGQWSWVAPWGWTWIGHEPWGFAPFHYGRWVHVRNRWGWVPGARIMRPVYAPALVAWVGTPGFNVSMHIGSAPPARWFPLAPREVYAPFYRGSPAYVHRINSPHVANIANVNEIVARPREFVRQSRFSYRDDPRAFSTASANSFQTQRQSSANLVSGSAATPADSRNFTSSTESRFDGARRREAENDARPGRQSASARSGQNPPPAFTAPRQSQREERASPSQTNRRDRAQEPNRQSSAPQPTRRFETRQENSAGQQGTSIRENPRNRSQEVNRPAASPRNSRENTNTNRREVRNERPVERAQPQPRNNVQPPQQRAQPPREERQQNNASRGNGQQRERGSRSLR